MTVLTTIPNGASNKDIRDTLNDVLDRILALEGTSVTPTPTPSATINNTASNSSLLPAAVGGATALFTSRQSDLDARRSAA